MKASGTLSGLFLLIALTSACGSTASGPGGTGGIGGIGGTGGIGGIGGSPVDPGGPLLDRPSGAKYDCSVSHPITRLAMPWGGFSLVPSPAGARLATVLADYNNPDPNKQGNSITWSTLGLDGTLGSPTVVRAMTNRYLGGVTAASKGEKSTIVWSEGSADSSSTSLNSLQLDASGAPVTAASVLTTEKQLAELKIARAGSGYALVWMGGNQTTPTLTFALLDEAGKLASAPVALAGARDIGSIISVGDRFVVSYVEYLPDSGLASQLLFLDSNGSALGQPITLELDQGVSSLFHYSSASLLARGDDVLAAWSVKIDDGSSHNTDGLPYQQDAATTIRIARFDANGKLQGSMYDLQAPVKNREAVQPFWVDMGDDVGLLWADGSIIYVCGGCEPNHSQKFVVLDGQSFTPQSNVVELLNTFPSGGLLSSAAERSGDDLLVVSTLTFHTWGEGASGALRCVK